MEERAGEVGHPATVTWEEHAEEMERLRAELTAECMSLEAVIENRNREIDSLRERLSCGRGGDPPPTARARVPDAVPARAAVPSPAADAARAASVARRAGPRPWQRARAVP